MAKTTAIAVRKNTLPTDWEKQVKADVEKGRKKVEHIGVSQRVKTKGGVLMFQDTPVPGNKLRCVTLCDTFENAYYEEDFDPENPQSPVCFAFGEDENEMAPHEASTKPQSETCKSCLLNKWGSAEKGRGKACKNQVRILLMHADHLKKPDSIADAPVAMLNVPPTSLAGWAKHVKTCDEVGGKPAYMVVTEVGAVPSQNGGFRLTFDVLNPINDKRVQQAVFMKRKSTIGDLEVPYQPQQERKKQSRAKTSKPAEKRY